MRWADRQRVYRRDYPPAARAPPPRAARRPGHDPALAPPTRPPPTGRPSPGPVGRPPRRPAGPGHPPGPRKPTWGYRRIHGELAMDAATRSAPPPSGPCCTTPAWTRRPDEPDHPGLTSCARRTRSPSTCFTSTRSRCTGSARSSSSSTPPAAKKPELPPGVPMTSIPGDPISPDKSKNLTRFARSGQSPGRSAPVSLQFRIRS